MDLITKEFGKRLTAREVANILGLDIKTVRKYYAELGGVKVGTRLIFFERRLMAALLEKSKQMDGTNQAKRKKNTGPRSNAFGIPRERRRPQHLTDDDPHNLFG